MTTNRNRPYEDIVAQLKDPENWVETGFNDVFLVANSVTLSELRFQMHLWATRDPAFSPGYVASAMTALHLEQIAHRDEARYVTGR